MEAGVPGTLVELVVATHLGPGHHLRHLVRRGSRSESAALRATGRANGGVVKVERMFDFFHVRIFLFRLVDVFLRAQ